MHNKLLNPYHLVTPIVVMSGRCMREHLIRSNVHKVLKTLDSRAMASHYLFTTITLYASPKRTIRSKEYALYWYRVS